MNPFVSVALWPFGFVTTTLTRPAACGGVVTVIEVLLATVTFVAAVVSNFTVAPEAKFVPVIVTDVPPAVDPGLGKTDVIVGGCGDGVPPLDAGNTVLSFFKAPGEVNRYVDGDITI